MKKNLHEFIRKNMELAVNDYGMIREGDKILIGLSGGADSFALLKVLSGKKIFISNNISLLPVHIDLGFKNNDTDLNHLKAYLEAQGHEYIIEKSNIGTLAHSDFNRLNPCFLCSRLRRKRIFEIADANHCNKIAYGHHKDDIVETLLINMFYGREISTMKPNQELFGGKFHIIRPLAYVWEQMIKKYAAQQKFPLFDNDCPTSNTSKRKYIKNLLNRLQKDNKHIKENIFKSLKHVKTDYLL